MKRYGVIQHLSFCYGHRLLDHPSKCAHLHGHNALVELQFEAEKLDRLGMVIDFNEIKERLKSWIDETLDHKMLLREDDPCLPVLQEMGEPVFTMKGNPTAENIARTIFEEAKRREMPITEVRVWETRAQCGIYGDKV